MRNMLFILVFIPFCLSAEPGNALTYKLEVGQKLTYEGESYRINKDGTTGRRTAYRNEFTVLGRAGNGGWWMFMRESTYSIEDGVRSKEPNNSAFTQLTLFPDGSTASYARPGMRDPRNLLPALPLPGRTEWTFTDDEQDSRIHYQLIDEGDDGVVSILGESDSIGDKVFAVTHRSRTRFDGTRGLPVSQEGRFRQAYGFDSTSGYRYTLSGVSTVAPKELARFRRDVQIYFDARERYQEVTDKVDADVNAVEGIMSEAAAILGGAKQALVTPEFIASMEELIERHGKAEPYYKESAARRAKVIDNPAADWTLTDLAGNQYVLEDLRGRVVVLDFWYRGCGWCVKSMPQIKDITARFSGKPVTVLGMNTDKVLDDALFVEELLQLNYPSLQSGTVHEQYGVQGFPALVVIDKNGIVRGIHGGYSPTLYEDISAEIEALL